MNRLFIVILVVAALLFPLYAAADGNVPDAAACIGKQLDKQLMKLYGSQASGISNSRARASIMIIGTTPANLNNLNQANALARQMTEEVSRWLMDRGYNYDEIRKGDAIRFEPRTGEFLLTREVSKLATRTGYGQAILVGTYVISGQDVRFTMSLICTNSNRVLAKANATIPITPDLKPLLVENYSGGMKPTVYTRLR